MTDDNHTPSAPAGGRTALRAALLVSYVAVCWSTVTGLLSIVVGVDAGSTALVGTGADVLADVVSSVVLIWRFRAERDGTRAPENAEAIAQRTSSTALLIVAIGLVAAAVTRIVSGQRTNADAASVALAATSVAVLPVLARWKYRVAAGVPSNALRTDAHITIVGATTAALALLGLAATAAFGWSLADPAAALIIAILVAKVGADGLRGSLH
jgi:divalent metal cation (Fe/Co/Zn/Cd) transporter